MPKRYKKKLLINITCYNLKITSTLIKTILTIGAGQSCGLLQHILACPINLADIIWFCPIVILLGILYVNHPLSDIILKASGDGVSEYSFMVVKSQFCNVTKLRD